jgi:site-specific recombinase XerD
LRFGATLDPHTKGFTLTALLGACGGDLQGLRDAALLSLGYDAGLRVSELVAVTVAHIDPHSDGSALLFIPSSKTDQEGQGPVFRRVGVDRRRLRTAVPPMAYEAIPGHTRHWQEKLKGKKAEPARTVYTVGTTSLSRQGVNGIYRRVALSAFDQGLVEMPIAKVEEAARALSSHSLRVGLTQDLFAAGEDGVGIAQALRWSSPSTALRYGRKLAARSNVAARVLSRIRA